ncbi:FAD-dependent monooxygenase [Kribbella italica]|uniref:2-polyprenyl-6-methoxyphenol hydroxylase-like FAD-dependent oxidoreductase n=1 Tax=Kribbella italica TaxID=1540520 RepID=A0A7W9JBU8_9ACTN|nr:FAD-dependent monooxygenase [Kribbella italica]MBB5839075.1 2-polyprenyl-6-methoxyphenol hydroxylase-like FAD-dependent oxidoreductase [Kribbella italica]
MTTFLISGASVAGPALAYWLQRFSHTATVIEKAPAPRPGGYAVDFRGASLDVLDRMGLRAAVEARATRMGGMDYVNESGKVVARTSETAFSGELEVLRGDLVEILYDATRDGVEYVFSDSITRLSEDADGVLVEFERGAPRRFDLVIGADGLHSTVRRLAFGPEQDFRHDLGYAVSVATVPNHLDLDHTGRLLSLPGKTVGAYSARGNTEAKALFYFATDTSKASKSPAVDRRDTAAQRQLVEDTFTGIGWEVPRLLSELRVADDFYFDSISQIKLDSYSRGRIALVGDAGYCASPLSGMGTSLGIVGAYVLAGELQAALTDAKDRRADDVAHRPGSTPAAAHLRAFAAYDAVMRPFVAACQKQAVDGARWFIPGSRAFLALRNLTFRLMPYLPWRKLIDELPLKVGNAVELKQYEARRPLPAVPPR